jgi:alkanesulfonate monooxygenase SsuD/methylene tetrahydromethanopterin reductase-like flavin-dependent oxidoreductase (luciferase family)
VVFIRDDRDDAERLFNEAFGTPEDVAERLSPYLELGHRHLVAGVPANYDEEAMTRLITEVKPLLEKV